MAMVTAPNSKTQRWPTTANTQTLATSRGSGPGANVPWFWDRADCSSFCWYKGMETIERHILLKHYDVTIHQFIKGFIKGHVIVLNSLC